VSIPDEQKRLEQAIRTGLVLITEGVVVAPLDGVPKILISTNPDGTRFVDIYFAGPIRAAGGTATVFPLILGDYARKLMGLGRYIATQEEVERYVEECDVYDEIVSRQYKLKPEEVRKIIENCPVCINGEPTEEREVSVNRDVPRVPTNRVRGGMCLVISEGIALKAMKILSFAKQLDLDWSWLEQIIKIEKKSDTEIKVLPNAKYLERLAAGRPIFSYPSRMGGFRLRYGRSRNSAAMGKSIHPATMIATDEFIAVGTQLKIERPGKAAGIFPCDSIEGPIVRLFSGEVRQLHSIKEAVSYKVQIDRILFLGDMLVTVGDFRKSGHPLLPVGYCEEWWALEVKKALSEGKTTLVDTAAALSDTRGVGFDTAVMLSRDLGVPLHSNFTWYYSALENKELVALRDALLAGKTDETAETKAFSVANSPATKELFEKIGCPHRVSADKTQLVFERDVGRALRAALGAENARDWTDEEIAQKSVMELVNLVSALVVRDKAGSFIGSRMGRPETAKPRQMVGNPNILFPIGFAGGPMRSINKAATFHEKDASTDNRIEAEVVLFKCDSCQEVLTGPYCFDCNKKTRPMFSCKACNVLNFTEKCYKCGSETDRFSTRKLDVAKMLSAAGKNLGIKVPDLVKGVRGMSNEHKVIEPLEKGLLRSLFDLHVFRDATVRYEMLNAPLTHFKPWEVGTPVSKLRELGYETDIHGAPLESDTQMLELFPQDVVINEDAGDFFVRVTKFVDEMLLRFYRTKELHRIHNRHELVGELLLGLAPHTSAAVVGRIIGYSKARVGFAHPYFHLAKRRNIDGDQDSMMLLSDGLLNFSHQYLPTHRGGRMDAPLVFTVILAPNEIDDEIYEMETVWEYPLELYEKTLKPIAPEAVQIERVKNRLGKDRQYSDLGYTHETAQFDAGPVITKYVTMQSMADKIKTQANLQQKIAALDFMDSLEIVMMSHFLPDLIGNTRSYARQSVRCTKCSSKFRRVPLTGKCLKCKGNLILTINEGGVKKYLSIAKEMIRTYDLSDFLKQRIALVEEEINAVFKPEKTKQKALFEFA
jgi:DNA polymerase II large subunit